MSDYRNLAYLIEAAAPDEFVRLNRAYPSAGALFQSSRKLGEATAAEPAAPKDAERDFCRTGLKVVKAGVEALTRRLGGKLRSARSLKVGGSLVAMACSAGLLASTLDFISVDRKVAALAFSVVAFLGSAAAAFSSDMSRLATPGPGGLNLLEQVAALGGKIEGAQVKFAAAEASGAFSYPDTLKDLNEAAGELARLKALFALR